MIGELDFSVIPASLQFIKTGLAFSANLTLFTMFWGIVIGTFLAMARLSSIRLISYPAAVYVDSMRSIPLVMLIMWFFFLIPYLIGKPIGAGTSAYITFTAFEAACYGEIMRAGIQSIPKGQSMAGLALGMTYWQNMWTVVLPQAFRNMLPLLMTQTIVVFQDTSLVYAIGAKDLLKAAEIAGRNHNRPIEMYLFAAALYFFLCFSLSLVVKRLQKKLAVVR